jgi:hypothetical protein
MSGTLQAKNKSIAQPQGPTASVKAAQKRTDNNTGGKAGESDQAAGGSDHVEAAPLVTAPPPQNAPAASKESAPETTSNSIDKSSHERSEDFAEQRLLEKLPSPGLIIDMEVLMLQAFLFKY